MRPAYVSCPSIALPPHEITMDEICSDIERANPGLPKLKVGLRFARRTQVETRRFTRPLAHPSVSGDAPAAERSRVSFADAASLGVGAARQALARTGLDARSVDCVVTSHTTSWTTPGLDVHLVEELGLRPDVRRVPMSTLGCVGGAQALAKAAEHIAAHPEATVLVVVAEKLSSVYNHRETTHESMIYKTLFGDSAGACVVTGTPLGPGLRVDSTWEYVLPRTRHRYFGRLESGGMHFGSDRSATESVNDTMPALREHLVQQRLHEVEFAIVHPGGPRIIEDVALGLGIDRATDLDDKERLTRHSWATLRQVGNLGGVSVLNVLARTHEDPPADGARGVLVGIGPGVTVTAATATWTG
ncbi:PhlD [Streptomyces sp. NPDC088747]|uniref:PhlD n=1 Tax=Streptomyces sp. NPDC088747 TaxID=3365886 RepID=UPI0038214E87